jgi:hypothetical protein
MKRNAQTRGIVFDVDITYVAFLWGVHGGRCSLSGVPIALPERTGGAHTASLDRIDSSLGYVQGNLQWVHKDVQRMKMDLEQDRFVELCRLIATSAPARDDARGGLVVEPVAAPAAA